MTLGHVKFEHFQCDIFLPRTKPSTQFVTEICHTLWKHGMSFSAPEKIFGTWEEELQSIPRANNKTVASLLEEIGQGSFWSLTCLDHSVEFELSFDTDLRSEWLWSPTEEQQKELDGLRLGRLELSVARSYMRLEDRIPEDETKHIPYSAFLTPPYYQVHLAMIHWLEILCAQIKPVFAVGYYTMNSVFPDEEDFHPYYDIAMISALEQGTLPERDKWFTSHFLLYTPASLKEEARIKGWLPDTMWRKPLPFGAEIAYVMPNTLDEERIYELNREADKILSQYRSLTPPEWNQTSIDNARQFLLRAQELAATIQQEPAYQTQSLLGQIAFMEEKQKRE